MTSCNAALGLHARMPQGENKSPKSVRNNRARMKGSQWSPLGNILPRVRPTFCSFHKPNLFAYTFPFSAGRESDLMSLAVYGSANDKLGKVENLVVDPVSGKTRYAVLSFGGILGMGNKYFAVPWNDLKVFYKGTTSAGTQKEVYATADISKESLKKAPSFDKDHWPDFADTNFVIDLEKFYGSNREAARIHEENR